MRVALLVLVACAVVAGPAAAAPISTVAGTLGSGGFSGDGGPAPLGRLSLPVGVTATPDGGFLIADQANNRVRRVTPDGTITTIAGATAPGFSGDGGPAVGAQFSAPSGVAQFPDGSVLVADANNNRVRKVAPNGTITTVIGDGSATFGGDGGPAAAAKVNFPYDIAPLPEGGYLVADQDNNRIRKVSAGGTISTVAGNGAAGSTGDGGPATSASLNDPAGVAVQPDGGFLIADTNNERVRRVGPDGTITTAAFGIEGPARVAVLPDGGFVVADRLHHRILRYGAAGGSPTTLAGTGSAGTLGDGGDSTLAQLNDPIGVAVTATGDVLVADTFNHAIRHVDLTPAPGSPPPPPPPPPTFEAVPPTVRLAISPNPTCVGVPTRIDASASTPGNGGPIVKYELLASAIASAAAQLPGTKSRALSPVQILQSQLAAVVEQQQLGGMVSGLGALPAPVTTTAFSWLAEQRASSTEIRLSRPPSDVTVIVTDAAGQKAAAQVRLEFNQKDPRDERQRCPRAQVVPDPPTSVSEIGKALAPEAKALQVQVSCAAARLLGQGCSGQVTVSAPSYELAAREVAAEKRLADAKKAAQGAQRKDDAAREAVEAAQDHVARVKDDIKKLLDQMSAANRAIASGAGAKPKTKRKRPVPAIAGRRAYRVTAGGRAALSVPLSSRARAILKRYKRLHVVVSTTAVSATGKPTVKSKRVTLTVTRRR